MIDRVADEIALYDINEARATAEVLDLSHGLQFVGGGQINGGGDIAVCADADLVVITAGAAQGGAGVTRLDLAGANVGLIRSILPPLLEVAPDAIYLLVTNPVDVVTYIAQEISGLPHESGHRQWHRARHVPAAPPARRPARHRREQRARLDRRRARRQ